MLGTACLCHLVHIKYSLLKGLFAHISSLYCSAFYPSRLVQSADSYNGVFTINYTQWLMHTCGE